MCPSKDTTLEPWPQEGGPLDEAARSRWLAALYAQLRARAQAELVGERAGHTLSAKALVNEVYIKLSGQRDLGRKADSPQASPLDRGVFFGLAAQSMRRILVDHARTHGRTKRGGGAKREGGDALQGLAGAYPSSPLSSNVNAALDPIDLDAALTKLSIEHEQAALCDRGTVVEGSGLVDSCLSSKAITEESRAGCSRWTTCADCQLCAGGRTKAEPRGFDE